MNIKKLALAFFAAVTTGSVVTIAAVSNKSILTLAQECDHVGNHYTELAATETESGTHEYWVCCKCHEHFLSQPEPKDSYTWTDAGVASQITDTADDRYIAPTGSSVPDYKTDPDGFADYLAELGFTVVSKNDDGTFTVGKFDSSTIKNCIVPEGVSVIKPGTFNTVTTTSSSHTCNLDWVVLPTSLTTINRNSCKGVTDVYFVSTSNAKSQSYLGNKGTVYSGEGTGWDYVDGVPTAK